MLAEGKTPAEALDNLNFCGIDVVATEIQRFFWSEFFRIGKKALPVIMALAVGILIGSWLLS